jgi:hypothetical protein
VADDERGQRRLVRHGDEAVDHALHLLGERLAAGEAEVRVVAL